MHNIHNIDRIKLLGDEPLSGSEKKLFESPVILWCGRFDHNKAPVRMLMAFIQANVPSNTQLVFLAVDTHKMWAEIRLMAKKHGFQDRVHFLGKQANPYKYMKNSTALVSTSYDENLPNVLIESLVLHTPVISTNSSQGVWTILSCEDNYDQDLDSYFIAKEGIITSNKEKNDKQHKDIDIRNLSTALSLITKNNSLDNSDFIFRENIFSGNIVDKYLEI